MTKPRTFATDRMHCWERSTPVSRELKALHQPHTSLSKWLEYSIIWYWHRLINIFPVKFRFETKYGPDSFVSRLTPLRSTIYDGLESYNPNKYIGKWQTRCTRFICFLYIYVYVNAHNKSFYMFWLEYRGIHGSLIRISTQAIVLRKNRWRKCFAGMQINQLSLAVGLLIRLIPFLNINRSVCSLEILG